MVFPHAHSCEGKFGASQALCPSWGRALALWARPLEAGRHGLGCVGCRPPSRPQKGPEIERPGSWSGAPWPHVRSPRSRVRSLFRQLPSYDSRGVVSPQRRPHGFLTAFLVSGKSRARRVSPRPWDGLPRSTQLLAVLRSAQEARPQNARVILWFEPMARAKALISFSIRWIWTYFPGT